MKGAAVAVRTPSQVARPLTVLVPLIREEIADGNSAGLEHYRQAGELLLEAREQVAEFKWGHWLKANFALHRTTAYDYMTLAEKIREHPELVGTSLRMFEIVHPDKHRQRKNQRQAFHTKKPIDIFDATRQARTEETRLLRMLAVELVDIGFKALATRLHPDHGGSEQAMRRLNRVRRELKSVAKTRRFE
jgi:hypothetical protein